MDAMTSGPAAESLATHVVGGDESGERHADPQRPPATDQCGRGEAGGTEGAGDARALRRHATRPVGITRSGRSTASTSRSAQSLSAMPDQ